MSSAQLERIQDGIESESITYAQLGLLAVELRRRVVDELGMRFYLWIPSKRMEYYDHPGFDASVTKEFPSATLDIEEAGKCFAVGRWTACVFHLMRVMEHGLRSLADMLGISHEFKTWDPIIKKLRVEIEDYQSSSFKGNLDFLRQGLDRLTAVQVALRNEVMHARSHYDEERAQDVYWAVRSFMQQLPIMKGTK